MKFWDDTYCFRQDCVIGIGEHTFHGLNKLIHLDQPNQQIHKGRHLKNAKCNLIKASALPTLDALWQG